MVVKQRNFTQPDTTALLSAEMVVA